MISGKKVLAIVPARLKSKRLKFKNIKILNKKPLFVWTLLTAKKSKYIDKIILSTESKKIVKIAKKFGFHTNFLRKKKLATDKSKTVDVVLYCLKKIKKNFDYIVVLQPTSPLRNSKDIDNSLKKIEKYKSNSLISLYKSEKKGKFPVILKNNLVKKNLNKKEANKSNYFLNGAIYIVTTKYFSKNKSFYSKKMISYKMPESRSIDIDTSADFEITKKFFKKKK